MPLVAGTKLGPYEIAGPLGAGGMGEVYRARDPRLGRDVAIKLLPEAFATDPERLARFEREARLLASFQHANIAVLHGLEESGGRRFLVMECVEGESLAQRLRRGPLPLAETLDLARAIAGALEAAHEGGIVHRDLKPGNVMVTPAGDVKVLDFGLARGGTGAAASGSDLSASPTLTYAGTQAGVILGTAAYMSPEQARGKAVDRRTDIWSFGCVLFECLAGRQAFAGETVSDIVARILQVEPEWAALPAGTPERLRALLRRCLEKDAKRRLRDIGDARIELEELIAVRASASGAKPAAMRAGAAPARTWVAIGVTAAAVAALTWFVPRAIAPPPAPRATRFEVAAPKGRTLPGDARAVSLSPDGRTLALIAADSSGDGSIWIRPLHSLAPRELPGTRGALWMFWSPDSRHLAFFAEDERLMKVAVDGGTPERVCETKAARGGSWNRDGTIVLAPYSNGGIYRVSAGGGEPVQVTRPDTTRGVTGHRFPVFLPDGKHFLFSAVPAGPDGKGGLCVGSLDRGEIRELARVESGVAFVPPDRVLTTRNGALVAYRLDTRALRLRGEPAVIGDQPVGTSYAGAAHVATSNNGTLAFLSSAQVPARLAWLDFEGRELGLPPIPPGAYTNVRVSPDGRRALVVREPAPLTSELLVVDLERGAVSKLSLPSERGALPEWSPDGTRVAYLDDGKADLHVVSLVDGSRRKLLADDPAYKRVYGWTPDGRKLLIARLDPVTKWDLWLLPLEGDGAPQPLVRTPANDNAGLISRDGRWLAFNSDESGPADVYVQSLLSPGLKYQVTIGGGGGIWAHDGKRFFYVQARELGVIRGAEVRAGPEFSLGPPMVIGHARLDAVAFDLAPDDRRLLALLPAEKAPEQAITVLQNWSAAIRTP